MTSTQEEAARLMERILDLIKSDEELHDAVLGLIGALTDTELAKADYHRSRTK